jgi:hypothetical protein
MCVGLASWRLGQKTPKVWIRKPGLWDGDAKADAQHLPHFHHTNRQPTK